MPVSKSLVDEGRFGLIKTLSSINSEGMKLNLVCKRTVGRIWVREFKPNLFSNANYEAVCWSASTPKTWEENRYPLCRPNNQDLKRVVRRQCRKASWESLISQHYIFDRLVTAGKKRGLRPAGVTQHGESLITLNFCNAMTTVWCRMESALALRQVAGIEDMRVVSQ
jgi:hypothetical protein